MFSRAVRIHEFGDADVLHIERVEVGEPGPGEVLLAIRAIGLNRTEITLRSGRSPNPAQLPTPIGFEAAGVVEKVGDGVTGFSPGDRVALVPSYGASRYGLYGEHSLAPASALGPIPADVDFRTAAATWVAFGTAWAGLAVTGGLRRGQTVLVSAASSSVGLAAIQVARRIGAVPIALTTSRPKAEAILEAGAEAVIDRASTDLVDEAKLLTSGAGVDLVFDPVDGPGFADLVRATGQGGRAILYGALDRRATEIPPFDIFGRGIEVGGVALTALARVPERLAAMKAFVSTGLEDGSLAPTIARTFAFDEIADAHRYLEAGGHVGKVVVTI